MLRKTTAILMILAGLVLAACNTVRGVGQDLKSAADAVDDTT